MKHPLVLKRLVWTIPILAPVMGLVSLVAGAATHDGVRGLHVL